MLALQSTHSLYVPKSLKSPSSAVPFYVQQDDRCRRPLLTSQNDLNGSCMAKYLIADRAKDFLARACVFGGMNDTKRLFSGLIIN